ncbi:MAG: hypothetical protein RSA10_00640 [Bacilli bacterium]
METVIQLRSDLSQINRKNLIGSLTNIKITLMTLRIKGEILIIKSNFKTVLDKEKSKNKDIVINNAIDDLFQDLFIEKESELLLDDKKDLTSVNIELQSKGEGLGGSRLVKAKAGFKQNDESDK